MIHQLFTRYPTDQELQKILKCYNLNGLDDDLNICHLTIKVYNTIAKLYDILDLLIDIYLPCKYKFISNLNIKRALTILRQILRLFECKLQKYQIGKAYIYKVQKNDNNVIKIQKNVSLKF